MPVTTLEELAGNHGERARHLMAGILDSLNRSINVEEITRNIIQSLQEFSGIEAVAVRMREGDDYPYYVSEGFPASFIKKEKYLCTRSDGKLVMDNEDLPALACMCGAVIRGKIDPSQPFFSEYGSFWTNSTSDLLEQATEEMRSGLRGYCNLAGYESVAIIPLVVDEEVVGALQLNDKRRDVFSQEIIHFYEEICGSLSTVLRRKQIEGRTAESEEMFRRLSEASFEAILLHEKGVCHLINDQFCTMFGYEKDEVVGKNVIPLLVAPESIDTVRAWIASGSPEPYEAVGLRKDGTRLIMQIRARETEYKGRRLRVAIARDITERKRMEEALAERERYYRTLLHSMHEDIIVIGSDYLTGDWRKCDHLVFV